MVAECRYLVCLLRAAIVDKVLPQEIQVMAGIMEEMEAQCRVQILVVGLQNRARCLVEV